MKALLIVALLGLAGCLSTETLSRDRVQDFHDRMLERAAFELDCPIPSLEVIDLVPRDPVWAGSQLGVRGCGRRAVYVYDPERDWVANTAAVEWTPETPSTVEALPPSQPPSAMPGAPMVVALRPVESDGGAVACELARASGEKLPEKTLRDELRARIATEPELRVSIAADRTCRHGDVVMLMELLKTEGVRRIALEVAPPSP